MCNCSGFKHFSKRYQFAGKSTVHFDCDVYQWQLCTFELVKIEKLYEDNHLLIVNKPPGYLVQGDHTGDSTILEELKEYLAKKYHKPGKVFLGTVHRLDRPVGGVLLFARTSKALIRLNEQFKSRRIEKTYWAVVEQLPQPTSSILVHWIRKDRKKNRVAVFDQYAPESKKAELSYRLIAESNQKYLLENFLQIKLLNM